MSQTVFITGGTRCGKSSFAERLAIRFGAPFGYLATAQALDEEMKERIRLHRQRRGNGWEVIEEPFHLSQALLSIDARYQVILVDCVTLWLSNLLCRAEPQSAVEDNIRAEVLQVRVTLDGMTTPVILVSNEVGMGIVPENRLARQFRDIAGNANQLLAASADEAWLVVSGMPLRLK